MNLAKNIERSQHFFPDKPALIFEGQSFTYCELNEMSNRIANGLSELGISRGDRVALFLPNIPAFVAAYLGIQKIGAVPVSINSALKAEEVKYIIEDSGALILITTEALRANIPAEEIPQLKQILIAEGEAKTDRALSEIMANAEPTALAIEMAEEEPAAILYTSGTTGFPKGAILSHGNLVSNIRMFVDTVGTHPDDRILLFLPASHSYGQTATLFPCLEVGATLVLHRELEIEGIIKSIVDNRVTTFFGVSTIYTLLYEKASAEQMRTISRYVSGGAPLPLELAKKWRDKFGVSINEKYGSTETSLICFNQTYKPGSVGLPLEGVEVKLIDSKTGQELKSGEVGEVVVRGPNVMLGYWNRPTETALVLKQGWFHTGDIGLTDEEGYFYLIDRIKDMINVGGLKVYPSEVENILSQHPAVAEVAVYGVPEPLLGEQVIASIIPKSDVAITNEEIVTFCRQNMADFKVPNLVELVESLPKGRTGKILKKILREQFKPRSKYDNESKHQKSLESLKKWLSDWLETELALDPETIEMDRAFADYGLNSTLAVVLAQDLSDWLEQPIEPIITWNFPTIAQITAHLLTEHVESITKAQSSEVSNFNTDTKEAELPTSAIEATSLGQPEPIAIIGMGCRFPGGTNTPAQFWELLYHGVDTVDEIPNSRWDVEAYYDPSPNTPGKMYVRTGSFLEGIDQFDPQFFGIAPLEATSLDPQQRLLLEVSWEALEQAGIAPEQLRESLTGVFVGSFWDDYSALHLYADDPSQIDAYRTLSNLRGLVAGRIAYVLGLQGPVMQLDTTCSSSLLSVHLACQSLRQKECHLALAGGVALNLSPELAIGLSSMTALAPDGRCKTFDAKADGFGLGEGCGMVILKRFSEAKRDGDNIMALIRGSAVNHDGRSNGLTAPNGLAQEALIKQALKNASVKSNQIQYVETHGTGTSLGDPIEVLALANVLGQERTTPLMIGSVKTNLGHLSSAAGIASLIKVVLSLQHAQIPPHLHFTEPNPHIPWDKLPLKVPTKPTPWTEESRLAGVSAFGMSGTNVHMLLEAFDTEQPEREMVERANRTWYLLPISAKTADAIQTLATHYVEWLDKHHNVALTDLCFTAATGRNHFAHRAAIVVDSKESLTEKLTQLAQDQATQAVFVGQHKQAPKLAMLFTGQGSQYSGMAQGLYETQPVFRQTLDRCATLLEPLLDIPLSTLLFDPTYTDKLNQTRYTQPALFAVEVALYELWKSIGIEPDMVIGHSVGEYAAAYAAGIMELETGLKLIAKRGELMGALSPGGAMAAIFIELESLQQAFINTGITLAADNGSHRVVSGSEEEVEALIEYFEKLAVRCQRLVTSHAFHSPLLEPMLDTFADFANQLEYQPAQRPFISNLTGNVWPSETRLTGNYWRDHARQQVQFAQGIQALAKNGCQVLLEIGPHPVLTAMALETWPSLDGQIAPLTLTSLHRKQQGERPFTEACAQLYAAGAIIDWAAWDQPWPRHKLTLPSYPFQRQRYWLDRQKLASKSRAVEHPLLGQKIHLSHSQEILYQSELSASYPAYLNDHQVYDQVILPATAYLEMALSAGLEIYQDEPYTLQNVVLKQALVLSEALETRVQLVLTPIEMGYNWQIFSQMKNEKEWQPHVSGVLVVSSAEFQPPSTDTLEAIKVRCSEEIPLDSYQQSLNEALYFGPDFQAMHQLYRGQGEGLGLIELPVSLQVEAEEYQLHPVLLDACLRIGDIIKMETEKVYLPFMVETIRLFDKQSYSKLWSYVSQVVTGDKETQFLKMNIWLFSETGQRVAELSGLTLRAASREAMIGLSLRTDWLYKLAWQPANWPSQSPYEGKAGRWLIVSSKGGQVDGLVQQLQIKGEAVDQITNDELGRKTDELPDYRGIIYLASSTEKTIPQAALDISNQVLQLIQMIIEHQGKPWIWLVTQEAVGDSVTHPEQATLWGLGRTMMWEHPELQCTCLDSSVETTLETLFKTIWYADDENQIAIRENQRLVARLIRYHSETPEALPISKDKSYLITGGLGGLGLKVAEYLVQAGVDHVILSSRQGAETETAQDAILHLEALGTQVLVVKADVSQEADVIRLLQESQQFAPLGGIIHAAGVLDDGLVTQQTLARFAKVFAPKVQGSWYLHQHSQEIPLDFFVCFSSQSSMLGNGGQINYASANAFMDALMHQRQAMGLPGLSINWGGWSEVGLAKDLANKQAISPKQGVELFGTLLGQAVPQVGVVPIKRQQFSQNLPSLARFPVLSKLIKSKQTERQSALRQQLSKASAKERYEILKNHIKSEIEVIVGTVPSDEQSFFDLGIDSLSSIQLLNRLSSALGISLPTTLLINHSSLKSLTFVLVEIVSSTGNREQLLQEVITIEKAVITDVPNIVKLLQSIQITEDNLLEKLDERHPNRYSRTGGFFEIFSEEEMRKLINSSEYLIYSAFHKTNLVGYSSMLINPTLVYKKWQLLMQSIQDLNERIVSTFVENFKHNKVVHLWDIAISSSHQTGNVSTVLHQIGKKALKERGFTHTFAETYNIIHNEIEYPNPNKLLLTELRESQIVGYVMKEFPIGEQIIKVKSDIHIGAIVDGDAIANT